MALPPVNRRANEFGNINRTLSPEFKTDWDAVRAKDAEIKAYLGTTDYSAQNQEANDFAKLQFALSLMGRGFAAMGAEPGQRESPAGTLGRTLIAPLAGDISTIAGPLMKQRAATRLAEQQEERQRRLAAYTATEASAKEQRALAEKLMVDPTKARAAGLTAGDYNLYKPDGKVFKIDGRTPVVRAISKGVNIGQWLDLGTVPPTIIPGKGLTARKITADSAGTKETDAQRQSASRLGLLLNSMSEIQVGKERGDTSAYNAKAAFYFDPKAHLAGKFAFKYIPAGTGINDRSRDVTITNPSIIKLINNKLRYVSDTILKADFGDTAADTQRTRLQDAVRRMLSLPASTVFGATPIEIIGKNAADQVIGYAPTVAATSAATVTENAKTAMATLGNAESRYIPLDGEGGVLSTLPAVDNEADSRTTWGRLKTAASVFPGAFSYTGKGKPGTDDYDELTVQQRLDIEAGLRNAALNPQASSTDHRAVLQKVAIASREKREKIQNKLSDDGNELFETRLAFRDALLQFKNAAIETGVAGYATGTAGGFLARVGFADFIVGKGSKHWARLKAASDRMSAGHSRRVGREFGDQRISNYDATDYKTLLPSIKNAEEFNRILVDDALKRTNVELTQLMENGGDVGWTRRQLEAAAKAGVDFSALRTKNNWHGHGYYGNNRYGASRQFTPTLSDAQRSTTRTQGQLEATMYDNTYTVPGVDFRTEQNYTFGPWKPATDDEAASGTQPLRMDEPQFETWLIGRAKAAFGIPEDAEPTPTQIEEMRKRVVRGILSFNAWRENSQ
jgi:septal ring-binding cell division protein DamX